MLRYHRCPEMGLYCDARLTRVILLLPSNLKATMNTDIYQPVELTRVSVNTSNVDAYVTPVYLVGTDEVGYMALVIRTSPDADGLHIFKMTGADHDKS